MKRLLIITGLMMFGSMAIGAIYVLAVCGDTWQSDGADTISEPYVGYGDTGTVTITKHWRIFWTDGYERRDATAVGSGEDYGNLFSTTHCHPEFSEPRWITNTNGTATWFQSVQNKGFTAGGSCGFMGFNDSLHRHDCRTGGEECLNGFLSEKSSAGESTSSLRPAPCEPTCDGLCEQNEGICQNGECIGGSPSPIVIDIFGNGFDLTNAANGVLFDIDVDNIREQVSWTAADTDDAWLALDRNRNGRIDSGRELFGNFTPQPAPTQGEQRNGFLALAEYDKPAKGGNGDNQIDVRDNIFAALLLWQDRNHNGISETSEMQNLSVSAIRIIELDYRESRRTDEFGNRFKYRAKVRDERGAQIGRWAWDVFLVIEP